MSTGLNVLRYSALGFGIFYGLSHQRKIYANDRVASEKHEYEQKVSLIDRAKAEFARKKNPPPENEVISDPQHPQFDLEKFLVHAAGEAKS
ncbi:MAG: hypothetical protein M1831_000683 [Alyxoria varia]|nr:MAG: hypothetical protein M1831_000683 [Alyxoria varia]